jgi:hypothetical protein
MIFDPATRRRLWDQAVTNNQKLNDCPKHYFTAELPPPLERFQARITCERCGGQMRLLDVNQYIRGYVAAGKNPNDIWPGWS